MIPREILKKIRQIELRTNRIVNETLRDDSLESPSQFRWVARGMENSHYANKLWLDVKEKTVAFEDFETGLPNGFAHELKSRRVFADAPEDGLDLRLESIPQSGLLVVAQAAASSNW